MTTSEPHSPAATPAGAPTAAEPTAADGLPEEFVLTPELVEEEAIRGDIVLRGAVVLLAVLFGWTHLTSTAVLTRIRSGEQIAASGWRPPATDVFFSITAGDRPWANLAWLGDLLLAGVHGLGGAALLSVWCAALGGLAFWLLGRVRIEGLPTWWGSLCGAAAVLAVFPLLTPGPSLMTLLGLAALLYCVHFAAARGAARGWWLLLPLMWLWGQLDERVYLGMAWLICYAAGTLLQRTAPETPRPGRWPLLLAIAAPLAHFFPLGVLRSPLVQWRSFHPLMREYGGELAAEHPYLWRPVWETLRQTTPGWHLSAALLLLAAALVTLLLNRRRLDPGQVLALIGVNLLGAASGIDFTAVALVNAAVAAFNGQQWYRHACRQEYTLNPRELLYSRGGRAATVLAFFLLAFVHISGHMTGAAGRRIGFGFSNRLQGLIDGYRGLLGEVGTDEFDDHPFHLTPQQGDLLIWLGRRSFTDSRLTLFGGLGGDAAQTDLLALQREIAEALRSPQQPLDSAQAIADWARRWQQPLDDFEITHVLVPLDTPVGFTLWVNLASQAATGGDGVVVPFWQQVGISGPAAVLYRRASIDTGEAPPGLMAFLAGRSSGSIVTETFRPPQVGEPVRRGLFPRGPTYYETSLLLPEPVVPNESLIAGHYATRLGVAERSLFETLAYCHQIVRHARRGLAVNPNSGETFLMLGDAYERLWDAEGSLASSRLAVEAADRRFHQALFAFHHAAICRPRDVQPHAHLYGLYVRHGDYDLALRHLDQVQELTGRFTLLPREDPRFATQQQQVKRLREQLLEAVQQAREASEKAAPAGLPAAVTAALQRRCPALALELLERDLTQTMQSLELIQQYVALLLLSGRTSDGLEQAAQQMASLERIPDAKAALQALRPIGAFAYLAADESERARSLWEEYGAARLRVVLESLLQTLPLVTAPPEQLDHWPVLQQLTVVDARDRWEPDWELACWQMAMCDLEEGRNQTARETLERVVQFSPGSQLRPQISAYLTMLTGEFFSPVPPGEDRSSPAPSPDRPPVSDRPPPPELPVPARD